MVSFFAFAAGFGASVPVLSAADSSDTLAAGFLRGRDLRAGLSVLGAASLDSPLVAAVVSVAAESVVASVVSFLALGLRGARLRLGFSAAVSAVLSVAVLSLAVLSLAVLSLPVLSTGVVLLSTLVSVEPSIAASVVSAVLSNTSPGTSCL